MKEAKATKFSKSIIFKSLVFLVLSVTAIVFLGIYFFNRIQTETVLSWADQSNRTQLKQVTITANNEIRLFANRVIFLTRTSEIQSMDSVTIADYLNSDNVSTLFNDKESVIVYDESGNVVSKRKEDQSSEADKFNVDISKIVDYNSYISSWLYNPETTQPLRLFAAGFEGKDEKKGSLVAYFSFKRLEAYFSNYKLGKDGFLIAIADNGDILYNPSVKEQDQGIFNIADLGFRKFNPKTFEITEPTFIELNDNKSYLINYEYSKAFNFGLISLQPKPEIDAMASTVKQSSILLLICFIIVICGISFWLYFILGSPLNKLIGHMKKITNGDLNVDEIKFGSRDDEIGQLSRAFNVMHSTIKRQIKELNSHRLLLEQEVKERTQELEAANQKLSLMSRTDELTGLPNRRDMHESIENEISRVSRSHKPFCFIFIDIDHFKKINDTYGHSCGDVVLKSVSQVIRSLLRNYDIVARYGGEEFLVLLPETDLDGATVVAERFRKTIEETNIKYADYIISVTITLGVSRYDGKLGADRSIQLADKALYEGKENGRNQVVVWTPDRTSDDEYKAAAIEMANIK